MSPMQILRRLLRGLSQNVVIRKRLPSSLGGGVVFCSPASMLSIWKPGWRSKQALGLLDWARRFVRRDMCVWDVGANQGIFAFAASAMAGSGGLIVAFEPDLFLVDLLRRSTVSGTHAGAPVRILPLAVGSEQCIAEFVIARTDRALNHLASSSGNPRTGGERDRTLVSCTSMDWLIGQIRQPDIVKIDIEGAELSALRGAVRLLSEVRPLLIIEVAPENAAAIAELLGAHGYAMCDVRDHSRVCRRLPAWNTLAWPSEKSWELDELRARIR